MTFDDGILTIYSVENIGETGMNPVVGLVQKERFYYGFDTLGITRYYTALEAQQQIECVVNVPGWGNIAATAEDVLVYFDYLEDVKIPIPDALRARLSA